MSRKKRIVYTLIAVLIFIQLFQPTENAGIGEGENSITASAEISQILKTSCYDCHSDHTDYPWYTHIQPVGWWLNHHVNEGKHELNFSEFKTYPLKRKLHKLKEIREQITEGEMPMSSYTWIHTDAPLTEEQKTKLLNWVQEMTTTLTDTVASL
ncbi:MAG: hypothetical protein JWP12_646 [Bacteroidetes bacterium]|nr:hypothetical protein [Bacteroidota bacterium]